MDDYLAALVARTQTALGSKLSGIYLYGSHAACAGLGIRSDIDVFVIIRDPTTQPERHTLARVLDRTALPVPAAGLELAVMTEATARDPKPPLRFDWAFETGWDRASVVHDGYVYEELVLDLAVARSQARTLFGLPAAEMFGEVSRDRILAMLVPSLAWHMPVIGDPHHDPGGQNAVLNAGRAILFAETGQLAAKTAGGRRLIQDAEWRDLAQGALDLRSGQRTAPLDRACVEQLLREAIRIVETALRP
jgi:predicted nucleotidyltransferase